jgi:hypothetical protein
MIWYIDNVNCIEPDRILETRPPIYRGQERPARGIEMEPIEYHTYSRYTSNLALFD